MGLSSLFFLRVLRGIKLNPRCCQIAYGFPQVGIIIFKILNAVGIGIGSRTDAGKPAGLGQFVFEIFIVGGVDARQTTFYIIT